MWAQEISRHTQLCFIRCWAALERPLFFISSFHQTLRSRDIFRAYFLVQTVHLRSIFPLILEPLEFVENLETPAVPSYTFANQINLLLPARLFSSLIHSSNRHHVPWKRMYLTRILRIIPIMSARPTLTFGILNMLGIFLVHGGTRRAAHSLISSGNDSPPRPATIV